MSTLETPVSLSVENTAMSEDMDSPVPTTLELTELILKNPVRADALSREEKRQSLLIPRLLGISLASYLLYSIAMIIILNTAKAEAYPHRFLPIPPARWTDASGFALAVGYLFGLVATTGICLPSFYFFALLAGVRMSMLQVVSHILRAKAAAALMLVGILPIYVAGVLGMAVFHLAAPVLEFWLYVGLLLPFVAGLEGVHRIYRGVLGMSLTMAPERRCRRECFLRRLTTAWATCYTLVSPVMIYRVWESVAQYLA